MGAHFEKRLVLGAAGAVALERDLNRIEEILVAERLGEKFHRSGLHGAHGHRNIAVSGDENDRNANVGLGELGLEIESADPRQPDIKDEAGGGIGQLEFQKIGRRGEYLGAQADRSQQAPECLAQRSVVVDHENGRLSVGLLLHDSASCPAAARAGLKIPIRSGTLTDGYLCKKPADWRAEKDQRWTSTLPASRRSLPSLPVQTNESAASDCRIDLSVATTT